MAENGVGQVRQFLTLFEEESANFPTELAVETNITLATGTLIYETFQKDVLPILNQIENLNVNLLPIVNNFYGTSVTVTGLLTGTDIITQLASEKIQKMIEKANGKNPEGAFLTADVWSKLPTTLKYKVSAKVMGTDVDVNF